MARRSSLLPSDASPGARPANARERLGQQTRERLLEVATELVLRNSVSAMAISGVVRQAGVPASSIYWHFTSKEGLVAAVAAAAVERWLALLPDPEALPATGEERVVAAVAGVTRALAADPRAVSLVIKVGVELGAGRHSALEVVRRARADVIGYGVRLFGPAFAGFSERDARAAAERLATLLMATADGIAVNAAIHGRSTAVLAEYRRLGDLAVLLYRAEMTAPSRRRGASARRGR